VIHRDRYRTILLEIWVIGVGHLLFLRNICVLTCNEESPLLSFSILLNMIGQTQSIRARRGLALLEVMIAVGLLTFAVTAITSAIVAGQQHSIEAREKIVAAVAVESLMSQLLQEPWESMNSWNGYTEEVGSITDPTGAILEGDWSQIGRRVSILDSEILVESLEVFIIGRTIEISAFTENGRILSTVERFIPEPQS